MERLDIYLQKTIEQEHGVLLSRTYIEKLLSQGGVMLNNEIIKKKGFRFKKTIIKPIIDEKILTRILMEYRTGKIQQQEGDMWSDSAIPSEMFLDPEKLERAGDIKQHILFENDDILVVHKPPGVLSHPGRGDEKRDSMVYQFMKYMQDTYQYIPRAGLVHRLDAETQGVLVFAKNMETYNDVKRQFEEKRIQKYYIAVCAKTQKVNNSVKRIAADLRKGEFDAQALLSQPADMFIKELQKYPSLELDGYIGQRRADTHMQFDKDKTILFRHKVRNIKNAESTISMIYESPDYYVCIVAPHTGRTHQIRVQLNFLGIPVLYDPMYGNRHFRTIMRGSSRIIDKAHISQFCSKDGENLYTRGGIMLLIAYAVSFFVKGEEIAISIK